MLIIGRPERFGFEILTDDLSGELADISILVSGQRVSGRNPVYLPTFVGELKEFLKCQKSPPTEFDFSSLSDVEAFSLFHEITEKGKKLGDLTPNVVWNYHYLHSIDDAVDDWEIYVFDVADQKHIVCRKKSGNSDANRNGERIWSSVMPRKEFNSTLTEFVNLFPDHY